MTSPLRQNRFSPAKWLWVAILALPAACTVETPQSRVEKGIREGIAIHGTVGAVEMAVQEDGTYRGTAVVRDTAGTESRLRCTTAFVPEGEGTRTRWTCTTPLGRADLERVETALRDRWSQRGGTVREVSMQRQDNDNMSGHIIVQAPYGETRRIPCTATRNAGVSPDFTFDCPRAGHEILSR